MEKKIFRARVTLPGGSQSEFFDNERDARNWLRSYCKDLPKGCYKGSIKEVER